MNAINIDEKLSSFDDHWNPRIIGELNGQHVKLAKFLGSFIFHKHDEEDEMFFVIKGNLKMAYEDRVEIIKEGELVIVPRGVMHKPIADEKVHVMLFEPASTINTGDLNHEKTRIDLEKI